MLTAVFKSHFDFNGGGNNREFRFTLLGWSIYFCLTLIYCASYELFINSAKPQVWVDVVWFAQEWGLWMVLTPFIFRWLRQLNAERPITLQQLVAVGACALLTTVIFRLLLDLVVAAAEGPIQSLVLHGPRYSFAAIAIVASWYGLLRQKHLASDTQQQPANDKTASAILAYKGSDKALVQVAQIHFVRAAKNYTELFTPSGMYLLRSTIKQMEELLPSQQFLRVHRSIIVNIADIQRIKSLPSGSGKILLANGEWVPISKRYLAQLQEFETRNLAKTE